MVDTHAFHVPFLKTSELAVEVVMGVELSLLSGLE